MLTNTFIFITTLSLLLSSCFKTTEQIQRERALDEMVGENRQSRSVLSELMVQQKSMQEEINQLSGQIDELKQQGMSKKNPEIVALHAQQNAHTEKILAIEAQIEEWQKTLAQMKEQLLEQERYRTETAKAFKAVSQTSGKKAKTISDQEELNQLPREAEKLLKQQKFDRVISLCDQALEHPDLSEGKKNKCRFYKGVAQKELKDFDEALVTLGQIYTDWPKSQLAPQALVEMAIILKEKKQDKQAKQMAAKIQEEYPKTPAAKTASNLFP